jgi:hypothetical protein
MFNYGIMCEYSLFLSNKLVNLKTVKLSKVTIKGLALRFIVFNATFNNISAILWRPVLLVEETRVPGESHRPVVSH